jgi:xylulokinase
MNGAGASFRWFRDQFGQLEVALAHFLDRDPYELLTEEAEKSPPGASGLIYLPYLAAERSPIWDPFARGVLFGLTIAHRRGDVIRAILEGVAFSIHHNLSIAQETLDMDIDSVRIGGGVTRSPLWNQIIADVTGKRLVTLSCTETETLGAAILAGVGTGVYKDFQEATERTLKLDRQFTPQSRWTSLYRRMFRIYHQLYHDLRHRFQEAVQIQNLSAGAET